MGLQASCTQVTFTVHEFSLIVTIIFNPKNKIYENFFDP